MKSNESIERNSVYMDFTSRLHGKNQSSYPAISLSRVTLWLTTFISSRNPEFDISVRVSILQPRHKQIELVTCKVIQKNASQDKLRRVYGAFVLRSACPLKCVYMENFL